MNGMILLAAALSAGLPKLEFAEWGALPPNIEMSVRREAGFAFIDVAPKAAATNAMPRRIDLPALTLRPFAAKPKAMSYAGLTEVAGHTGAIGYLAVAEPFTRRGVVCGFNYRFGARGAGTPDLLRSAFPVPDTLGASVLPELTVSLPDGTSGAVTVSSSRIREALASGRPEAAAAMLGRPYALRTRVVPGKRLGRTIGFPTANQYFPPERLIPKKGVYAVRVTTPDGVFPGIADVGSHPTVDKRARVNCETHVLGYSGDLYGRRIKVEFLRFIRPEQKFDRLEELTAAIRRDADTAEKLLRERI